MLLSYQYRLYPFQDQVRALDHHRRELTFLWNFALGQRKDAWRAEQRSVSYIDQQRDLTQWRTYDREGLGRLSVAVAQDSLQRLDLAFRAFFRRVTEGEKPGYPRFRRAVNSFTYTPSVLSSPVVPGPNRTWRVKFPRVGEIPSATSSPPNGGLRENGDREVRGRGVVCNARRRYPGPSAFPLFGSHEFSRGGFRPDPSGHPLDGRGRPASEDSPEGGAPFGAEAATPLSKAPGLASVFAAEDAGGEVPREGPAATEMVRAPALARLGRPIRPDRLRGYRRRCLP